MRSPAQRSRSAQELWGAALDFGLRPSIFFFFFFFFKKKKKGGGGGGGGEKKKKKMMIWNLGMLVSDQQPEIEAPEELLADMPLPSDAKTFFLGGIFVLLILTAAYVASEIVLPMIFAVMLNLLMQPALRALQRLRTPRALGALVLILVVIATIVGLGAAVIGPAEAWIAKLPKGITRILSGGDFLMGPSIRFGHFWPQPKVLAPRAAAKFGRAFGRGAIFRASSPGRGASPAVCSPPSCFSTSSSFRATVSCDGWSRSCPGSPASGRRSTSRSKSGAIFPLISSQSP